MDILITGGSGFIGQTLVPQLLLKGHNVSVFTRQPEWVKQQWPDVQAIRQWKQLKQCPEAVINLAGEGIANARWSSARKQKLWDSRVTFSQEMLRRFNKRGWRPEIVLSGSAVGYYGNCLDHWVDETKGPGHDFGAQLCQSWELCMAPFQEAGSRLCWLRTGLVVGRGGILEKLYMPFRLGLGGRLGSGQQFMSWIHIQDWVNIAVCLLEDDQASGPFNVCAPEPVTNQVFTEALARQLNRPAFFHQPARLLRLMLGEMGDLLLTGQRVEPKKLTSTGYEFQFSDLKSALKDIFESDNGSFSSKRTN